MQEHVPNTVLESQFSSFGGNVTTGRDSAGPSSLAGRTEGTYHGSDGRVHNVQRYILCRMEPYHSPAALLFKSQRHPKCPWLMLRCAECVLRRGGEEGASWCAVCT